MKNWSIQKYDEIHGKIITPEYKVPGTSYVKSCPTVESVLSINTTSICIYCCTGRSNLEGSSTGPFKLEPYQAQHRNTEQWHRVRVRVRARVGGLALGAMHA